MYSEADDDEEGPQMEIQESLTPKINKFTHDACDWLLLVTLVFVVVYGILYIFYEIALGMANIRWVYSVFFLVCLVDMVMYLITRFAVVGGDTNYCLVYVAFFCFVVNLLCNLIAPAIVLVSYELTLEHPTGKEVAGSSDNPVEDCGAEGTGFKCGVVRSIRTSVWCMYLLLVPRPLIIYGIVNILRQNFKPKGYRNVK